jgi:hypothetical protein
MRSPLSPDFQAHHNAVMTACQEEKHKILYFIRLVTVLNAKYRVLSPAETGRHTFSNI